jgi:hypothetical protein
MLASAIVGCIGDASSWRRFQQAIDSGQFVKGWKTTDSLGFSC